MGLHSNDVLTSDPNIVFQYLLYLAMDTEK